MTRDPIPKEIRAEVRQKFGGCCAYCGVTLKKSFHVDHVIPVAAGGVDDICNYFPACSHCNTFKNALSLEQFRASIQHQPFKAGFIIAERFNMIQILPPVVVVFHFERQGHVFDEALVREMMRRSPRGFSTNE